MRSDDELERLVARYASLIDAAIRRVCARHYSYVVPDVRQEVHLAIWRQLEAGNNPVREASYIYKVALTTALREVRRIQRESETAAAKGLVDEQMHVAVNPDSDLERAEQLDFALGKVEGRQRQAVKAYLAGFNHGEIADLLGISPAQARHAVYRGIEQIHRALAAQEQAANDQ